MTNFTATIPAVRMDEANEALGELGFGYGNFSVPLSSVPGDKPDICALHCWSNPAFEQAITDLGYATITRAETVTIGPDDEEVRAPTGKPNLDAVCEAEGYEKWKQPVGAGDDLPMTGDRVTEGGKVWESLIDYNVWKPGTAGWREIVATGYPAWVQPVGALDAYPLGFKVSHKGQNWESAYAANVWEPGVFGWTRINIPADEMPAAWSQQTYPLGAKVTFKGASYESLIANNSWSPEAYPAGWKKL